MPTNPSPRIQVQVVSYNSAHLLETCLTAVFSQTVRPEKILVIDNHSQDDSVRVAQSLGDAITVVALQSNTGYAGGHNLGFREAWRSGVDYVLTLNPDTVISNDYVERVMAALESRPGCGGAIGKLVRQGHTVDSAGLVMERFCHVRDIASNRPDSAVYNQAGDVWGICGAAAMYASAMLKDIADADGSVFDESFFLYKEDVDLCWRAKRRSWSFWYEPFANATHARGWAAHNRLSSVAASHSFANQVALLVRHVPAWSQPLVISIFVETVRWVLLFCSRPQVAYRALRLILVHYAHHRQQRRRFCQRDTVKVSVLYDLCRPGHV